MPDNAVEVELIDVDVIDLKAPLTWSTDKETLRALLTKLVDWMRAHPYRINDEAWVVVTREIYLRIRGTIYTSNYATPQQAEYDTVRRQIDNDTRITGTLKQHCDEVFDDVWCSVANDLLASFTKHAPDDND